MREDVAGHRNVAGQWPCLPAQNVGTLVHESLILHQPRRPSGRTAIGRLDGTMPVSNRMRRIGDVAVELRAASFTRGINRQDSGGMKIPFAALHAFTRRPCLESPPLVGSCLKGQRRGKTDL